MNGVASHLIGLLQERCSPESRGLYIRAAQAFTDTGRAAFAREFAAAPRRLGKELVVLSASERASWDQTDWSLPHGLTLDELARIAMLAGLPEAEQEAMAADCYRRGDTRERQAVLRALPLLDSPDRFIALAVGACRTNVVPEFEAIACENAYPMRYFPDASYNQMVLKALFVGVTLSRIIGLSERTTPELARMAHAYASERRAAGRTVPGDIDRHFGESFNLGPARRAP